MRDPSLDDLIVRLEKELFRIEQSLDPLPKPERQRLFRQALWRFWRDWYEFQDGHDSNRVVFWKGPDAHRRQIVKEMTRTLKTSGFPEAGDLYEKVYPGESR